MMLFIREFKKVIFSVMYLFFVAAVLIFYSTQFASVVTNDVKISAPDNVGSPLAAPLQNQEDYGITLSKNPQKVMSAVAINLFLEHGMNVYPTYPAGFIKTVTLNEQEQNQIQKTIETITGMNSEKLQSVYRSFQEENIGDNNLKLKHSEILDIETGYEEFLKEMSKTDKLLGGGSSFDSTRFTTSIYETRTYEQAVYEYEELTKEDKVTRAYARLFCDYIGLAIALFSIFVPVGFLLQDRRAKVQELVYSRSISSMKIVATRYIACLAAIIIPVIVLSIIPSVQLIGFSKAHTISIDYFAFFTYIITWLLPTAMVCCSVGFFFTILTNTPIALAVQLVWTIADIASTVTQGGDYFYTLTIRHNQVGARSLMIENMKTLVANRIGIVILALILFGMSILIYEYKRKGKLNGLQKSFKRSSATIKNSIPF